MSGKEIKENKNPRSSGGNGVQRNGKKMVQTRSKNHDRRI
jgi:hypothetical protein